MDKILITNPTLKGLLDFTKHIEPLLSDKAYMKTTTGDWFDQASFAQNCQVFNLRIQEKPWVIVYCATADDVLNTYKTAIDNNLPIRIRAGGHDHEGECTGTNTILIDVSQMTDVEVNEETLMAKIGPGNIFKKLTSDLAEAEVMIPHGTCATVGISGFVMGGGWGPWTRKHGMCCERLMGADLVLGDGSTVSVDADGDDIPDLLWALRGGGGMSYGLVTEFRIKTFKLPETLIRFSIEWNPYTPEWADFPDYVFPTIQVLKAWENVIESDQTSQLIGTNLQVNGHPLSEFQSDDLDSYYHNCKMYGYWEGNEDDLKAFIKEWFSSVPVYNLDINPHFGGTGSKSAYGNMLMSDWARESFNKMLMAMPKPEAESLADADQAKLLAEGKPLPPDYDDPAPHKITSRLVNPSGLGDEGYLAFLQSLTNPLIMPGNRKLGLFQYVTLGAIVGDYYRNNPTGGNSAFPYKDKLYTIQYQTWWNLETYQQYAGQNNPVNDRYNRALDWMEVARDYDIPNTTGAFISFKDSSIPTKTYFAQNYERLMWIKENYSKDPLNHFRIRKSII